MKECFAGGNTSNGFVNYLPGLLEGKSTVWLLKGCPGSGKSSFLKRIGSFAEGRGEEVIAVRCSSDTDSFDGIVLPGRSFAVVDATAPHAIPPTYPIAIHREIGMAAHTRVDAAGGKEIIRLSDEKAGLYAKAYALLATVGALRNSLRLALGKYILYDKLSSFARRRTASVKTPGEHTHLQAEALGKYGVQRLGTFADTKDVISLSGDADIADLLMKAVLDHTAGKKAYYSYDFADPTRISEVYFPGEGLLFSSHPGGEELNVRRFISVGGMKNTRALRRYAKNQVGYLTTLAGEYISEATKLHAEMEKIYISGTDFEKLTADEDALMDELSVLLG